MVADATSAAKCAVVWIAFGTLLRAVLAYPRCAKKSGSVVSKKILRQVWRGTSASSAATMARANAAPALRRQRHDRVQQRGIAVNFETAKSDRHVVTLEAPEQLAGLSNVDGWKAGFRERRCETVTLQGRKRCRDQPLRAQGHYKMSFTRSGGRHSRVPLRERTTGRSISSGCSLIAAINSASVSFGSSRPRSS